MEEEAGKAWLQRSFHLPVVKGLIVVSGAFPAAAL